MVISGVKWLVIEKLSLQLSKFLFFIVLARALGPKEFGVISVAYFFVALCDAFLTSGFTHGFIRDKFKSKDEETRSLNSLLVLNLIFGVILSLIMWQSSEYIGIYYESHDVKRAVELLAYTVFVNSLISTMRAKNDKELNFYITSITNIIALVVSYILTFFVYYFSIIDLDYNLLLFQLISYKVLYLILMSVSFVKCFDITYGCSRFKLTQYFKYGWKLQLATLLTSITKDIATMIIGKKLGLTMASIYSRANNLQILSNQLVIQVADRIAFPSFTKEFKSNYELVDGSKELLRVLSIIILPIVVITFFNANNIILLLLGDKWISAIIVLKILSINGFFRYIQTVHLNIAKIIGKSSVVLFVRVLELVLIIAFSQIFLSKGLEFFCYVIVMINALSTIFLCYYSKFRVGFSLTEQISTLFVPVIMNMTIGIVINYIYITWEQCLGLHMSVYCSTYVIFYSTFLWLKKEPLITRLYSGLKGN